MNFIWDKITEWLKGLLVGGIVSNLPGIGVGLILILASFIFRYGAELEGKANARLADSGESGLDS